MENLVNDLLNSAQAAELRATTETEMVELDPAPQSKGTRARKGKKTPKRTRAKAAQAAPKPKVAREPRVKPVPFEPSDEQLALLDRVRVLIQKNGDNIFAIGAALIPLQESIPEKAWSKFLKRIGLTVRTAWNYMSVARSLMYNRRALVEADIGPTVLYVLARGPRTIVEVVLEAYRSGERLTVAAVRRLVDDALGVKPKPISDALDQGGLAGMRRAAAAKLEADAAELVRLGKAMLDVIVEALKLAANGKRLNKGDLAARLVPDSREAHRLVRSIAAPLEGVNNTRAARETGWGKAQVLLDQMSTEPRWPSKADLDVWLSLEVVPTLEFVVHGKGAAPTQKIDTDLPVAVEEVADHINEVVVIDAEEPKEIEIAEPASVEHLDNEERAAAIFEARDANEPIDVPVVAEEFAKEPTRIEVEAPPLAPAMSPARPKVPAFLTQKL